MLKDSNLLRIATFNIWNDDSLWLERLETICEEIRTISPHILALQEVRSCVNLNSKKNVAQYIADQTGYPFCIFKEYPDSPDEGLAFLSKTPIIAEEAIWETDTEELNYCAIRITLKYNDYKFGITNVHLNWKSSRIRQDQMNTVNNWIKNRCSDYELLCGDFNDDPHSRMYHDLIQKHWIDVAQHKEIQDNSIPQPTLDYKKNPDLKGDVKQGKRYDWIMILENAAFKFPSIEKVSLFGDSAITLTDVFPSDYYGVLLDLQFDK